MLEHFVIPEEVKHNPNDYRQFPESMDKCSYRLELVPSHMELHRYRRPCFTPIDEATPNHPKFSALPHRPGFCRARI